MLETRYVRTRGGHVVHRRGCVQLKRARTVHPWHWAEVYGDNLQALWEFVDMTVGMDRIRFCRDCCPEVPSVG